MAWETRPDVIANAITWLENEVHDRADEACIAGAKVLGQALSSAAPQRTGRLSGSFLQVGPAPQRFRLPKYAGLARVGPMAFYGPMLEAGRDAGTSRHGRKYPAMSARPFIHRTDRATRGRVYEVIRDHLPTEADVRKGRKAVFSASGERRK